MTLQPEYALIVVSVFAACIAVLAAGPFIGRVAGVRSGLLPALLTGFEAGMVGYAIYGAVFGAENLYRFAIVDLGQVAFVFFVLATWLTRWEGGSETRLRDTALTFVRTPVILAIACGIAGSAIGLGTTLDASMIGEAVLATVGLVAAMTTPLICIVIGALLRGSDAAHSVRRWHRHRADDALGGARARVQHPRH